MNDLDYRQKERALALPPSESQMMTLLHVMPKSKAI